ncbi:hypothetical protein ACQPYK_38800 [Streptosporangium sp. CA-135522]|uniref:hypothetical protein n=1 Tax=Streptosporangium sp. CA-135522 TaxID=3240072 RepID=UPI003D91059E
MSRIRITMDNAALRDVAMRTAAEKKPLFDARATQVVQRVEASHGGEPVEEVYAALRAALLQLPGIQQFEEAQIRRCATRISLRQDPMTEA